MARSWLVSVFSMLVLAGCGGAGASDSHHFVLVHGAFQGAWVWSDVAADLRARGHTVSVVELPAHGDDEGDVASATMDAYVARAVAAIDASSGPVILVGHSMGGLVISGAAEQRPARVERSIYVAAFIPQDGDALLGLASRDEGSELGAALTDDGSDGTLDVREDALVPVFCADCDAAARAELASRYRTEPALPLTQPLALTDDAFGSVPRAYLFTTDDRTVSRAFQGTLVAERGVVESAEIGTGHSPFLSMPAATAAALIALAD